MTKDRIDSRIGVAHWNGWIKFLVRVFERELKEILSITIKSNWREEQTEGLGEVNKIFCSCVLELIISLTIFLF